MQKKDKIMKFASHKNEWEEKTTREKIFEVAVDLFSRKGFSGVSVREITKEVGIKESSLYNHFKSKDEILKAIFDYFQLEAEKMNLSEADIEEMVVSLSPDALLHKMLMKFKWYADTPLMEKIYRIIIIEQFRDERARDIRLREMFERPLEECEKIFGMMMEKNLIRQIDPKILAVQYRYVLHSLAAKYNILKCYKHDTGEIEKQMVDHVKFIYKLIKKESGEEKLSIGKGG